MNLVSDLAAHAAAASSARGVHGGAVLAIVDDNNDGFVGPGIIAFLIVVALAVILWFLVKNMGKQLGKANAYFEAEDAKLAAEGGAAAKSGAGPDQGGSAKA